VSWSWKRGVLATVNHSDIRGLLTVTVSRARMIVIRRELPRSRGVGQLRLTPVRHIGAPRVLRDRCLASRPRTLSSGSLLFRLVLTVRHIPFLHRRAVRAADVNRRQCARERRRSRGA